MTQQNEFHTIHENAPRRSFWLPTLTVAVVLTCGYSIYQSSQIYGMQHDMSAYQKDVSAVRANTSTDGAEIRKQLDQLRNVVANSGQQNGKGWTDELAATRRRADAAVKRVEKEQRASVAALTDQLGKVKESSEQASTRLDGVTSDITAVKTDVASTRADLDKTSSAMQSVRGDLGVMSGLIATNETEIGELRRLGDRNIFEFTLHNKDGNTKVGDIVVRLAKVNVKRNRYTVVVNNDDKTIEKRDKTTNEPVQFYVVSKARQPYELVVNEVSKDTVKGYLATPKVTLSRNNGSN